MTPLIAAIITVFSVMFIIMSLDCVLRRQVAYIVTSSGEDADDIEVRLRTLIRRNPRSEIFVADNSRTEEAEIILQKLATDFPQIHIVKCE